MGCLATKTSLQCVLQGHAQEIENRVNPVRSCVQSIRGAGTVCVLGLGNDPSPIVFKELIWKEGRIVSSRVSHGEFAETIDHLTRGTLKPEALISGTLPASKAQDGFEMLETSEIIEVKHVVGRQLARHFRLFFHLFMQSGTGQH